MHNPNSNTYIIVYSTVMVVIVATLLAVASLSLQKRQAENELQEKKSNILQSLGYSPDENPQEFDRRWPISTTRSNPSSSMPTA